MKGKVIEYKVNSKKGRKKGKKVLRKKRDNNLIELQAIISPEYYQDDLIRKEIMNNLRNRRRKL